MWTAILYSEKKREYDLGHVLTCDRHELFVRLFKQKLGGNPAFEIVKLGHTTQANLQLVHTQGYIRPVGECESRDPHDTSLSPGVIKAAKLVAGAGKLVLSYFRTRSSNENLRSSSHAAGFEILFQRCNSIL